MKISILLSSRGRSNLLKHCWEKCFSLAKYPTEIEWITYIDDDDLETISVYKKMMEDERCGKNTIIVSGKRQDTIAGGHNKCYNKAAADICMLCADDIEFEIENWDEIVINEFNKYDDKIVLVYGNHNHNKYIDGVKSNNYKRNKIAITFFLHKNWINLVGYISPPFFVFGEGDRWVTEISRRINRLNYVDNLRFRHLIDETRGDDTKECRKGLTTSKAMLKLYRTKEMKIERKRNVTVLLDFIKNYKNVDRSIDN